MFLSLLKKLKALLPRLFRKSDFKLPPPFRIEAREIEKAFARLFATDDGKKVLGHLNGITFMRTAGMEASNDVLRHLDGQRYLLTAIIRLIERGRSN